MWYHLLIAVGGSALLLCGWVWVQWRCGTLAGRSAGPDASGEPRGCAGCLWTARCAEPQPPRVGEDDGCRDEARAQMEYPRLEARAAPRAPLH